MIGRWEIPNDDDAQAIGTRPECLLCRLAQQRL